MTNEHDTPPGRGRHCPICAKPQAARWQPFCSKRCADVDLGRWLKESYRIPTTDAAPADGEGDDDGAAGGDEAR